MIVLLSAFWHEMVWVDETATHMFMTPTHGRARRGKRVGYKGRKRYRKFTLIAAAGLEGVIATRLVEGHMKLEDWLAFLKEDLLPAIQGSERPVQWDNLKAHHSYQGRLMMHEAGHLVCFQPPYSPEANPIEEMFSKLKTHLRYAKAKTLAALRQALASGFESISSRNMCAYAFHSLINVSNWCS